MKYNRYVSCNEVLSSTCRDNSPVSKVTWPLNKSTGQRLIYTGLASTESKIFTNTGKKMPKFELKTIDTVVLQSSSDWNL